VLAVFTTLLLGGAAFIVAGLFATTALADTRADKLDPCFIALEGACGVTGLGVGLTTARGLLAGRFTWRWVAVAFSAVLSLGLLVAVITTVLFINIEVSIPLAFPLLTGGVCAVASLVGLLAPRTTAWFRLAEQTRREHRQMLRNLSE
jgi:hypothetical protein